MCSAFCLLSVQPLQLHLCCLCREKYFSCSRSPHGMLKSLSGLSSKNSTDNLRWCLNVSRFRGFVFESKISNEGVLKNQFLFPQSTTAPGADKSLVSWLGPEPTWHQTHFPRLADWGSIWQEAGTYQAEWPHSAHKLPATHQRSSWWRMQHCWVSAQTGENTGVLKKLLEFMSEINFPLLESSKRKIL